MPFSSLADPLSIKVWMRTWDEVDKVRVRSGARVDDSGERNLQELHFEHKKRPHRTWSGRGLSWNRKGNSRVLLGFLRDQAQHYTLLQKQGGVLAWERSTRAVIPWLIRGGNRCVLQPVEGP